MTTRRLLWGMTWRGAVRGSLFGLIIGLLSLFILVALAFLSTLVFPPEPTNLERQYTEEIGWLGIMIVLVYLILLLGARGALIGFLLGSSDGLAIGILITRFFLKNISPRLMHLYRFAAIVSGLIGMIGTAFAIPLVLASFGGEYSGPDWRIISIWISFSVIVGLLFIPFVGFRLIRWYENEMQKSSSSS